MKTTALKSAPRRAASACASAILVGVSIGVRCFWRRMRTRTAPRALRVVVALAFLVADLRSETGESEPLTGVVLEVPAAPTPIPTREGVQLLYELHVTNLRTNELELDRFEILEESSLEPRIAFPAGYLDSWMRRPLPASRPRLIGSGQRAVVFVNLAFQSNSLPARMRQRLTFRMAGNRDLPEAGELQVLRNPPIAIGPPLRGGHWFVMNGLASHSHHRLSWFPVAGRPVVPQRYAIDWIQLGPNDRPFQGDPGVLTNHFGYGADLIAVADATVVAVRDGYPDNPPLSRDGVPTAMDHATGNHILLELDPGHFALYAHLQPGSLRVAVGDHVRSGQLLGKLGNSGSSTVPHLHFHVVGANSPLFADGLPYVLTAFEWQGAAESFDALMEGKGFTRPSGPNPDRCAGQLPVNHSVVSFP